MKRRIGEFVKVREDLVIGEEYWDNDENDFEVFINGMPKGFSSVIIGFEDNGYLISGGLGYVYTDEMLVG